MKEYLLLAAFMIPSLVVLGAAVTTVSLADHLTAGEIPRHESKVQLPNCDLVDSMPAGLRVTAN